MPVSPLYLLLLPLSLCSPPTICGVVYDGGGLTAPQLQVEGSVAVRRLVMTSEVSTLIVTRGCVLTAYGDTEDDEKILELESDCSATVLEQSTVIPSLASKIHSLHCYCGSTCSGSGYSRYNVIIIILLHIVVIIL